MSNKIVVVSSAFTDEHKRIIEAVASKHGETVDFYTTSQEAIPHVEDAEVVYGFGTKLPEAAPKLKWFCTSSAGIDIYVGSKAFENKDVLFTNSSGSYGLPIAEHIIMMSLQLMRRMPDYQKLIDSRGWTKDYLPIKTLFGSKILVLGTGNLGTVFAERVRSFEPESLVGISRSGAPNDAFDRVFSMDALKAAIGGGSAGIVDAAGSNSAGGGVADGSNSVGGGVADGLNSVGGGVADRSNSPGGGNAVNLDKDMVDDLSEIIENTDLLVMCLPGGAGTENVLDAAFIDKLPSDAYVVNVGRGSSVDEDSLQAALTEGRLAGAALDVFKTEPLPPESSLWSTPGLLVTPHISGQEANPWTVMNNALMFAEDLDNYLSGRPLVHTASLKAGY